MIVRLTRQEAVKRMKDLGKEVEPDQEDQDGGKFIHGKDWTRNVLVIVKKGREVVCDDGDSYAPTAEGWWECVETNTMRL